MVARLSVAAFALMAWTANGAPITVLSDTTTYRVIKFPNQNDYYNEAQTGDPAADIVGNGQHAGFYTAFDGTYTYYRVRLGSHDSAGYKGVFWVGIDVNSDGGPDVFIAVNNQGSNRKIQYQDAGPGANLSPSTTTIERPSKTLAFDYTPNVNYHYAQVGPQLEPGLVDLDLDGDTAIDAFLTFGIPFFEAAGPTSLQSAVFALTGVRITTATQFSYVIATATQDQSINQDVGGLPSNYNAQLTWRQLGGISDPIYANGDIVTPESQTWLLMLSGLGLVAIGRRRWRR